MKVTGSLSIFKSSLSTRVPPVLQLFPLQSFTLPLGSGMNNGHFRQTLSTYPILAPSQRMSLPT